MPSKRGQKQDRGKRLKALTPPDQKFRHGAGGLFQGGNSTYVQPEGSCREVKSLGYGMAPMREGVTRDPNSKPKIAWAKGCPGNAKGL